MKVKEVMTVDPTAVWITDSLANAAVCMWQNDCGVLPIIKDGRKVVGIITDRDICMATAIRNRPESSISVEEVMTGDVYSVMPDDDVHKALELMQEHRVRRLAVLDAEGELQGMLSMNDIVLKAQEANGKKPPLTFHDVVKTYKAICEHPVPMVAAAATAGAE
ncbi:MAG TPA: CBS domain-containing protein [Pyrinomonadaceae bacterium]|jgi:CBS domain-containing protein|nr:CBS domain-containing protein [Pyrinomonadaceae bacterium]